MNAFLNSYSIEQACITYIFRDRNKKLKNMKLQFF